MDDCATSIPATPTILRASASTLGFISLVAPLCLLALCATVGAVRSVTILGHLLWSSIGLATGLFVLSVSTTILSNCTFMKLAPDGLTLSVRGRAATLSWSDVGPFYASLGMPGTAPHVFCRVLSSGHRRIPAITGWQRYMHQLDIPSWFGFGGYSISELARLLNAYRNESVAPTGDHSSNISNTPAFDKLAPATIITAVMIAITPGWEFGSSPPTYAGIYAAILCSLLVGAPVLLWPGHLAWARRRYSWAIIDYLVSVAAVTWGVSTLVFLTF